MPVLVCASGKTPAYSTGEARNLPGFEAEERIPGEYATTAVQVYVDGTNFRRTARILGVCHRTVINWVNAAADALPEEPPVPSDVPLEVNELDELFTFVEKKRKKSTS